MSEEEIKKELVREIMAKQQWYEAYQKEKENHKWKENEQKELLKYKSTKIEELRNQNAELRDELEVKNTELNKEKEKREYASLEKEDLLRTSISKDKINAKIEALEKEQKDCILYKETENCNECMEHCWTFPMIRVLQELLEEEE